MSHFKAYRAKARSMTKSGADQNEDSLLRLSFEKALDDPQIAAKIVVMIRTPKKGNPGSISALGQGIKWSTTQHTHTHTRSHTHTLGCIMLSVPSCY